MAELNRWWSAIPDERYWLETTNRDDIGVDLNAPQAAETGQTYWGYALIREVAPGDVIFHYSKPDQSIVGWSRSVGRYYEDEVYWGARGASARGVGVTPYYRPGWRLGLEGPFPFVAPVSLAALRAAAAQVRAVKAQLPLAGGPSYFPFELSEKRPLRPTQAYLTKFPVALVMAIPQLRELLPDAEVAPASLTRPTPRRSSRREYRRADENARTARRQPFDVDPSEVDRALRSHAATQNALATFVASRGWTPQSPLSTDPQFDLAWIGPGDALWIAEVKSLTALNEERQMRLALGQVLRYCDLAGTVDGSGIVPVVVPERRPTDPSWMRLCAGLGVRVAWPGYWDELIVAA